MIKATKWIIACIVLVISQVNPALNDILEGHDKFKRRIQKLNQEGLLHRVEL